MNKIVAVVSAAVALLAFSSSVMADDPSVGANNFTPVIRDNNLGEANGFYNMQWESGYEGEAKLLIKNDTNNSITYSVSMNKATTNRNGVIDYDKSEANNPSDPMNIASVITVPEMIEVEPHSEETVKLSINVPNEELNGIKLGGVIVSDVAQESESQKTVYAFPVIMRSGNETPEHKITFGKFNFKSIGAGLYSLETPFDNAGANWFSSANIGVTVEDKSGNVVIDDSRVVNISPESKVNYAVPFDYELSSGEYTVIFKFDSKKVSLTETQKVTLTREIEKDIKNTVLIESKEGGASYEYVMFGFISILLGFAVGVVTSKKR